MIIYHPVKICDFSIFAQMEKKLDFFSKQLNNIYQNI